MPYFSIAMNHIIVDYKMCMNVISLFITLFMFIISLFVVKNVEGPRKISYTNWVTLYK